MSEIAGRCLCGNVSFKLFGEPLLTRICWCRDCQHLAANGSVNALVPAEALTISGTVTEFIKVADSGNQVIRQFCATCGTHLFALSAARPELRVLRVGNLDNPSSIKPIMNIWADSAPEWACIDPSIERVAQQPIPPKAS